MAWDDPVGGGGTDRGRGPFRTSCRTADQSFRHSYRPLVQNDFNASILPGEYEMKAELNIMAVSLGDRGFTQLQLDIMPDNSVFALIRPIKSWLALDSLIQNLEITDFALKHLQRIFERPFCEEMRAEEMQLTWENIPYTFEADGMPAFLGTLSKHIANEVKCILARKYSAYSAALMRTQWARQDTRAKVKLDKFCKEYLLKDVEGDPWQWSCAFEDLLRESADFENTSSGRASDLILDDLQRHKQRLIAGLIQYRSSVQVQIGKAQSIRVTFLAIGTSFAFAAWSFYLNSYL